MTVNATLLLPMYVLGQITNPRCGYDLMLISGYVTTGLDILREWAGGVAFDPAEVEKERGVVRPPQLRQRHVVRSTTRRR